jgi:hypothetical protein
MVKVLIKCAANIFALIFSLSPFLSLPYIHQFSIEQVFFAYFTGVVLFCLSWSCGLLGITRHVLLASLLAQLGAKISTKEIELSSVIIGALIVVVSHLFISHWKTTSESLNTFKTLWVDWFLAIPLFPLFAFSDLLLKTDIFFALLGYWIASTFFSVGTLKASELIWKYMYSEIYPVPSQEDVTLDPNKNPISMSKISAATVDYMIFIHRTSILKTTWKKLGLDQLIFALWLLYFLFGHWVLLQEFEIWQLTFIFGSLSSLLIYFGPLGAGFQLTPAQLFQVLDASN